MTLRDSQQRAVTPPCMAKGINPLWNPSLELNMSKSESRKACRILSFRLTPDEHAQLEAVAVVSGVGVSAFVRRAAFSSASLPAPTYEPKQPDKSAADYSRLLGAINKMGNNLNQIAKVANSSKSVPTLRELKIVFAEIRALRTDLIESSKMHHGGAK